MTKLELNEKLIELYGLKPLFQSFAGFDVNGGVVYEYLPLIADWNRLMPLALTHGLSIELGSIFSKDFVKKEYVLVREKLAWVNSDDPVYLKDHESLEDAARFAIAMALVELAESKS